jgi:hypothetical protein
LVGSGKRSAEIDFLFENADSSAAGDQNGPIVEGIGKLSDAAIGSRGRFVDVDGALHIESFMRTLVVELLNEGVELSLLLKEVGTCRPRSFYL